MNFANLNVQKREVKAALKQPLTLKATWEPISITWFIKWKQYVDFDNEGDDTRDQEVTTSSFLVVPQIPLLFVF